MCAEGVGRAACPRPQRIWPVSVDRSRSADLSTFRGVLAGECPPCGTRLGEGTWRQPTAEDLDRLTIRRTAARARPTSTAQATRSAPPVPASHPRICDNRASRTARGFNNLRATERPCQHGQHVAGRLPVGDIARGDAGLTSTAVPGSAKHQRPAPHPRRPAPWAATLLRRSAAAPRAAPALAGGAGASRAGTSRATPTPPSTGEVRPAGTRKTACDQGEYSSVAGGCATPGATPAATALATPAATAAATLPRRPPSVRPRPSGPRSRSPAQRQRLPGQARNGPRPGHTRAGTAPRPMPGPLQRRSPTHLSLKTGP